MMYHVGLIRYGRTAVFQFRRCVDFLDCEILEYFGTRCTTKADARLRLKGNKALVLADLRLRFPGRFDNVTSVRID